MPDGELHVVLSTHTPRHLARVLCGLGAQERRPDSVILTCDTDDGAIAEVAESAAAELGAPLVLVQRAHTGKSRSAQVRNNGVRALLEASGGARGGVLVFLDGDCVPARGCLAAHAALCRARTLVVGFRIDLTEAQTEGFDESALGRGETPVMVTQEQWAGLDRRAARYRRRAMLRRVGLAKAHKPKLLSANFSVRLADYLEVNGFDESYEGYGQEDDDLGRRLYRLGCRPRIAFRETLTWHQYHATRAPGAWHESPNAGRFAGAFEVRCRHGVENPLPQPPVSVKILGGALNRAGA